MRVVPVLSASGTEDRAPQAGLNLDDLSLYELPVQKHNFNPAEPGELEETVGALRRSMEPSFSWCRDAYHKIKPRIQNGVQLCSDTYAFLRDPPKDFFPRAGVIGFTGILGVFLARGSRVKRLLYPAGLMAVSSSLYYPERAASITTATGDRVYAGAVQGYAAVEKIFKGETPKKQTDSEDKP